MNVLMLLKEKMDEALRKPHGSEINNKPVYGGTNVFSETLIIGETNYLKVSKGMKELFYDSSRNNLLVFDSGNDSKTEYIIRYTHPKAFEFLYVINYQKEKIWLCIGIIQLFLQANLLYFVV